MAAATFIFLLIVAVCQGLQMTIDQTVSYQKNFPTVCGVLICTEEIAPPNQEDAQDTESSSTSTGTSVGTATDSSGTQTTELKLTSMSIYRRPENASLYTEEGFGGEETLFASLTAEEINIPDSTLGIVFSGHLTDAEASLQVGLMTNESCNSEYSCLVFMTDQEGGQHSSELSITIDQTPFTDRCPMSSNTDWLMYNITNPQSCERDMIPVSLQAMIPYVAVYPNDGSVAQVPILCDTHTLGGGWIVVQRRSTGHIDFNRGWEDYKNGFGSLSDDYWLGLETLHALTDSGTYEMMIDLENLYDGQHYSAHYTKVYVTNEEKDYILTIWGYDGTAGDSLSHHNNTAFVTFQDAGIYVPWYSECQTVLTGGGWWYKECPESCLNGEVWLDESVHGIYWHQLYQSGSASTSKMMIRRVD